MILIKLFPPLRACMLSIPFSIKPEAPHPASICLLLGLCHQDSFTFLPYTDSVTTQHSSHVLPLSPIPVSTCDSLLPIFTKARFSLSKPNWKLLCRAPSRGSGKDRWGFSLSLVYAAWSVFISSHVILRHFLWMLFSHLDNTSLATPPSHQSRVQAFQFLWQIAQVLAPSRCCSGEV